MRPNARSIRSACRWRRRSAAVLSWGGDGSARSAAQVNMASMHTTTRARGAIAVAPHALAARSALEVMREGGDAVEAMVAAAATIAVVYPHMNSIGGDAFWLVHLPGEAPQAIDASGPAAMKASIAFYRDQRIEAIPFRGGLAANTVAGTIAGWDAALAFSRERLQGRIPLSRLLADAIGYARDGITVTASQSRTTSAKLQGL